MYKHMTTFKADDVKDYTSKILDKLQEKIDEWQETYDERSGNEPEYESQQIKWQDALDRLEDKINEAQELYDELYEWDEDFDPHMPIIGTQKHYTLVHYRYQTDIDYEGLGKIVNDMKQFSFTYKGLGPIIKMIDKLYLDLRY